MRSSPILLVGLLALGGCGTQADSTGRWISLARATQESEELAPREAVLADGQRVEFEQVGGELWGVVSVPAEAWHAVKNYDVASAPAPLLGLGRPAYRLEVEGQDCAQASPGGDSLTRVMRAFVPGTFGTWRNALYLGVAPGTPYPRSAKLRVRLDAGAPDALGFHLVRGRRFSGKGLSVWPGQTRERVLDIPAARALRFGICSEPASALDPPGTRHVFRVRVDGQLAFEQSLACEPGGSYGWHSVPVPERKGARLTFEVSGPFAYTSFLDPQLAPAERGSYAARPWSAPPSVVLFLADTFRADNLAFYGGAADIAPELGRFGEHGLRCARAWSVGTFTLPAHCSLFSGLYPHQASMGGFSSALPTEVDTIAEVLARAGYRTGAITDSAVVSLRFGLQQGFDWFDESDLGLDSTLARARDFLDADDGRPVFLFVHTYRTHLPYREHEPPGAAARSNQAGMEEYQRLMGSLQGTPDEAFERDRERTLGVAGGLADLYRRGARSLDRGFGAFWRDLQARGFPAAGYVVFTSDHGEAFFEHGQFSHQGRVFEEQIRVPLLVRGPDVAARTLEHPVSLIDLPPTLAAMARVAPLAVWQGTNLLTLDRARPLYAFECAEGELSTVAILQGSRKLIALEQTQARRLQKPWQAFDLADDPGETRDLLADGPAAWPTELFQSSASRVEALLVPLVTPEASALDADRLEELHALGYAAD